MTSREIGRILARWERGEPIGDEELARLERMREENPRDFRRIAPLLSLIRRDGGGAPLLESEAPDIAGRVVERIERVLAEGMTGREESSPPSVREVRPSGPSRRGPGPVITRVLPQAAAALILLGVGILLGVALSTRPGRPADTVVVRFELDAPKARTVSVVGDFNNWQPEGMVMHKKSGMWEISIPLRRGEVYTYNFLVNGRSWIPDPSSLYRVRDGFGGEKSVLQL